MDTPVLVRHPNCSSLENSLTANDEDSGDEQDVVLDNLTVNQLCGDAEATVSRYDGTKYNLDSRAVTELPPLNISADKEDNVEQGRSYLSEGPGHNTQLSPKNI